MLKRILNLNLNRTPLIESVTLDPRFYKYPTVYKHAGRADAAMRISEMFTGWSF
jgi:hypothetical protein